MNKTKFVVSQIIRGLGRLPYVGQHDGLWLSFLLISFNGLLIYFQELPNGLSSLLITLLVIVPFDLVSAYQRAQESDCLVKRFGNEE